MQALLEGKRQEAPDLDEQLQAAKAHLLNSKHEDALLRANLEAQLDAFLIAQVCSVPPTA